MALKLSDVLFLQLLTLFFGTLMKFLLNDEEEFSLVRLQILIRNQHLYNQYI